MSKLLLCLFILAGILSVLLAIVSIQALIECEYVKAICYAILSYIMAPKFKLRK